jgi:hypothetical protein
MLSTDTTQKQHGIHRNNMRYEFSTEHAKLSPAFIIKTMLKIIKIKSKDGMNEETRIQFSKIVDSVIQMVEEI